MKILRTNATEITEANLRAVAALGKGVLNYRYEDCWNAFTVQFDCAQLTQLARQELIRRGIETRELEGK